MSYKQDPNNASKQVPDSPNFSETYNEATTPAKQVIVERPNYVVLNTAGNYSFMYNSGSFPAAYVSGSTIGEDMGPVKLDIQPLAWDGSAGTGAVTFVYKRVR